MSARLVSHAVWVFAALIILNAPAAEPGSVLPRVVSYELDATFYPERSAMDAIAEIELEPVPPETDSLVFFLHGELRVDSVAIDGRSTGKSEAGLFYYYDYSLIARRVAVDVSRFERPGRMTVHYSGFFHASRARAASDYMRIDDGGVFLRSYGYSLWFPVPVGPNGEDYRVGLESVTIRTPLPYRSVLIGNLLSAEARGGWYVSRWSAESVRIRDVQCVARPYVADRRPSVTLYHLDDSLSVRGARYLGDRVDRFRGFYESNYGEALAGTIHLIEMPAFGDISDHNIVGLAEDGWRTAGDDAWVIETLAHELVHPYVQVYVGRDDPLYALSVEGFSRFYHLPALESVLGGGWLAGEMAGIERDYVSAKTTGRDSRGRPLPAEVPLLEIGPDEIGAYKDGYILSGRAALFLYWLYRRLGPENFYGFSREVFGYEGLSLEAYLATIERYLPGSAADVGAWLSSNDFPERFRLDEE